MVSWEIGKGAVAGSPALCTRRWDEAPAPLLVCCAVPGPGSAA